MPARSLPTSRIRLSLVGFYAVAMLTSGCWVRNGSYCQQDSDCESNICADYQPMVKSGTCASALAQSTKQCNLTLTCIDKVLGRTFGRSVAFNDYPKSASLLGGFSSGISVCDDGGSITDVKYGVPPRTLVPPGPITGLPGQLYQWLSGSSDSGQLFQIETGPSSAATVYSLPSGKFSSAVAASQSWLAVSDRMNQLLWIWKTKEYAGLGTTPTPKQGTEDGYGRALSVSENYIAVGTSSNPVLYSIQDVNTLTKINITRPAYVNNGFGSVLSVSDIGLFVSDNTKESLGAAVWFYPHGSDTAQKLPVPTRFFGRADVTGYGAALASQNNRVVIGVPGSGDVVVLEKSGDGWKELPVVPASTSGASSLLGAAVALDGDWLAVGAPGEGRIYVYLCQ
jgi:hypothetical protein